jgi:hypothetical protein
VLCHLALIQLHMTVAIFTHSCHDCPWVMFLGFPSVSSQHTINRQNY